MLGLTGTPRRPRPTHDGPGGAVGKERPSQRCVDLPAVHTPAASVPMARPRRATAVELFHICRMQISRVLHRC
jgi:hypothetical protein